MKNIPSFNLLLQKTIKNNWQSPSLTDYEAETFLYKDVATAIERFHILYKELGIRPGDKIALCARNSSRWGMAFLSILTYGAVAVPILHEFHPQQIQDILAHSESKLFFVGEKEWNGLTTFSAPHVLAVISTTDYRLVQAKDSTIETLFARLDLLFETLHPQGFNPTDIGYHIDEAEELALINYTSGTTSNSKGVMIPYRAVWSNYQFAINVLGTHLHKGDHMLSMLPMAHMYGMSFEFIFEFMHGMHIHFLQKMASPSVLLKALSDVKPVLLILVPLIIEKIVRKNILPQLEKPAIKWGLKTPIVRLFIKRKIRLALGKALGGNFYEVIIGGAALNQDIENILRDIHFRFTVGYGATECAPIITYSDYKESVPYSCGKIVERQELKIDSPDPQQIPGEILTRGLNVMLGYYKNDEATSQTIDSDGWYHTGDLGIVDKKGNLFIKGRSKNLLLGSNGQNIYPEEIEDKLSNMPLVSECIVIQKEQKLYALVYPDQDSIEKSKLNTQEVHEIMEKNRADLNLAIPKYSQITGIKLMDKEFEKTPKKSIKRFLYTNVEI